MALGRIVTETGNWCESVESFRFSVPTLITYNRPATTGYQSIANLSYTVHSPASDTNTLSPCTDLLTAAHYLDATSLYNQRPPRERHLRDRARELCSAAAGSVTGGPAGIGAREGDDLWPCQSAYGQGRKRGTHDVIGARGVLFAPARVHEPHQPISPDPCSFRGVLRTPRRYRYIPGMSSGGA